MTDSRHVDVYADGSSLGNPGRAGWGVVFVAPNGETMEMSGAVRHASNNKMELQAVCEALEALPRDCIGSVYTDSAYVVNGAAHWRKSWERNKFKTTAGKEVSNLDRWRKLFDQIDAHGGMTIKWIKGHSTNRHNNRADDLARTAATNGEGTNLSY